jgi:DNA-nicking Smr family endonuclease
VQVLDLHGLHIAEATVLLEEELPKLCSAGLSTVSIVTGSGHHSKGSNYKVNSRELLYKVCTTTVFAGTTASNHACSCYAACLLLCSMQQ